MAGPGNFSSAFLDLSCSVAPFFPFCLVAAPLKWSKPKKGFPFFSRVTEQLSHGLEGPNLEGTHVGLKGPKGQIFQSAISLAG